MPTMSTCFAGSSLFLCNNNPEFWAPKRRTFLLLRDTVSWGIAKVLSALLEADHLLLGVQDMNLANRLSSLLWASAVSGRRGCVAVLINAGAPRISPLRGSALTAAVKR